MPGILRVSKIVTQDIETGAVNTKYCLVGLNKCRSRLKKLEHELLEKISHLKHKLRREIHEQFNLLETQINSLQKQLSAIELELQNDLIPIPALQALFESIIGQPVTITTPAGPITGVVLAVGTDAVEIQEATGDIVIIPFSKITSVQ